jgi:hypothetical protein
MVHRIQVEVSPQLAGQIPDREPAVTSGCFRPVVAREGNGGDLGTGLVAAQDRYHEIEGGLALDPFPKGIQKDLVVNAREELPHVAFENMGVRVYEPPAALAGRRRALPDLARETPRDEPTFQHRGKPVAHGMMHHPVREWRSGNLTALRLMDQKATIRAWLPGSRHQLFPEPCQLRFASPPPFHHIRPA